LASSRDHDIHLYTKYGQQRSVVANSETKLRYALTSGLVIVLDKQRSAMQQTNTEHYNAQFYDKVSELNRRYVIRILLYRQA
jgi:hypothetical protein